jgi:hypothetical protein
MKIDLERSTLLADGIYKVRIMETEDRTSAAGNPYVNLTCDVLDEAGKSTGNTIWHTLTMTPKAKFMVGRFLDAVGAPLTGSLNSRSLKNKTLWAKIGKDTYQGKSKNVIIEPLTPEQAGKDAETINNVFNLGDDADTSNGFEDDIAGWETEDDDGLANVPDEMSEDSRF